MKSEEWKEIERDVLSQRAKSGLHERAKKLKWGNPHPALGYKLSKAGWLIVDSEEAELVREVFDNYIFFESLQKTALALNLADFETKKGNRWRPGAVRYILCNATYKGNFRFAGVTKHLAKLRIISDEIFLKVQNIRKRNFDKYGKSGSTFIYQNMPDIPEEWMPLTVARIRDLECEREGE